MLNEYELQTRADISVCQGSLTVWEKVVLIRNQIELEERGRCVVRLWVLAQHQGLT